MIYSQPIRNKEFNHKFAFVFDRAVAKGTLVRVKPTDFHSIMKCFALKNIRVNDEGEELPITFTSNTVNFSDVSCWGLYQHMRPLAEVVLPRDVQPGDRLVFDLEMLQNAPARAGRKYVFRLEMLHNHDEIDGVFCAEDEVIVFCPREPKKLLAYLKSDGRVLVQYFDECNNPVAPDVKTLTMTYAGVSKEFAVEANGKDSIEFILPTEGLTRVTVRDELEREAVSNYFPRVFGKNVYFGEFHWHCELSADGSRPLTEALRIARDNLGLDFAGDGDHIWKHGQYTNTSLYISDQKKAFAEVEPEKPGKFATIAGAEANGCRGHVNIYARNIDEFEKVMTAEPDKISTIQEHPNVWPLRQLNDAIEADGHRAMLIPHHPNVDSYTCGGYVGADGLPAWGAFPWPANGNAYRHVRQIEIVQSGGSFETEDYQDGWRMKKTAGALGGSARTALIKGFKVGFCGCSDDHDGVPTGFIGNRAVGCTGLLADKLTNDEIFDNMYERHTYATSGARIVAGAQMDGKLLGSQIYQVPAQERKMDIEIHGTAPIEVVEIIHAGIVLESLPVDGSADFVYSWVDKRPGRPFNEAWYYVRARQTDGECIWLSPFFVDLPEELI